MTIKGETLLGQGNFAFPLPSDQIAGREIEVGPNTKFEGRFNDSKITVEDMGNTPIKKGVGGYVTVSWTDSEPTGVGFQQAQDVDVLHVNGRTVTIAEIAQNGSIILSIRGVSGFSMAKFTHQLDR